MNPDTGEQRKLDVLFVNGVAWTAGAKWGTQLLAWTSVFITARLLTRAEFGISEMGAIFYGLTNVLAEFGLGMAVLQMRDLERGVLSQLHTFCCLLCTLMFLLSLLAAPWVAEFFGNQELVPLIMVNNVAFFITGFEAVPFALLQRDMDYRRLSLADGALVVVQSVVTIVAAWLGLGYWSLVAGAGIGKATVAALAWYWKPLPFVLPRWKEIRSAVAFGRQVALGRLAWAAYSQADGVVVGRILGDSALGVYRMAMNFASAPAEKISALIMRATGPLFAKVQGDLAMVRRYFLTVTEVFAFTMVPVVLGLIVAAPEAVRVALGPGWDGVVRPLQWLAVFMGLRTLGSLCEQVLTSMRHVRFTMTMSMVNLAVMPVGFYIAASWQGSDAVAAAWLLASPVTILPLVVKLMRRIELSYTALLGVLVPALAAGSVMVLVLMGTRVWVATLRWPAVAMLTIEVIVGATGYAAVLMLFFRERVLRYVRFLRDLRKDRPPVV